MINIVRALFVFLLCISPAAAQEQKKDDPAFLQRALAAMQVQRNQALDSAAVEAARVVGLTEDLAKAQARIKELEKVAAPPKK